MSKAPVGKKTKQSKITSDLGRHKTQLLDDGSSAAKKQKTSDYQLHFLEEDLVLQKDSSVDEETTDTNESLGVNFNAMFSGLGAGISKTASAKTKLADQFSNDMLKSSMDFIDHVIISHQNKRDELQKQFTTNLKQMLKKKENELNIAKENEEKLIRNLQQHMKYSQQKLITLTKLDKEITEMTSIYVKSVEQLEIAQNKELEQAKAKTQEKLISTKKKFCKDLSGLEVSVMKKSFMQMFK